MPLSPNRRNRFARNRPITIRNPLIVAIAAIALATSAAACGGTSTPSAGEPAEIADAGRKVSEPTVATDPSGRDVYVAWSVFKGFYNGDSYLIASHDGGETFGKPVHLGGDTEEYSMTPLIAVADDGTVTVAWTHLELDLLIDPEDKWSNASWQMVANSTDGGRTFSKPVPVPRAGAKKFGYFLAMSSSPDGSTTTLYWLDWTFTYFEKEPENLSEGAVLYASTSTDGGRTFGPAKKLADHACVCCTPAGYFLDGHPGVVARGLERGNVRNPISVVSSDDGTAWKPPATIHEDGFKLPICPHVGLGAGVSGDELHTAWWTGAEGRKAIWYSTSADGTEFTDPVKVADMELPPHDNGVTLAVDGNETSWITTVDPEGGHHGSAILLWTVDGDGEVEDVGVGGATGELPYVTGDESGGYLVWADGPKVMLSRLEDGR
ncbi:MAG: sialidase family protein [Solirubrobacterales bacterium]